MKIDFDEIEIYASMDEIRNARDMLNDLIDNENLPNEIIFNNDGNNLVRVNKNGNEKSN